MNGHSYNQRSYKTEAIILSRRNFGEADKILTVLTRYHGKLRLVAKGIRRPSSRKRGNLELFNQVSIFLAKGKNLDIITEAETKRNFNAWRTNLLKVAVAYHLCEVINKLTREGQEMRRLYDLLSEALGNLEIISVSDLRLFVADFKKRVLVELGFLVDREYTDLDNYIEGLIQSKLRTNRFLKSLA